jgi:hypothetical protein
MIILENDEEEKNKWAHLYLILQFH